MDMMTLTFDRYCALADLAKTLGHAHRLILLEHIAQGERSVERLAELAGLSIPNTSQHLQQLRRAGLVQTRRDGKHVLYRLGDGPVIGVLAELRRFSDFAQGARNQLIADTLSRPDNVEAVSRDELLRLVEGGSVTLIDVRPREEYDLGHLPGAQSIPVEDLAGRLGELAPDREIVAYCRGPYCILSVQAIEFLKTQGIAAKRFVGGVPEWKAAGLPCQ